MHQVEQETQFQKVVEWDICEDKARKLVDDIEKTEDYPVCKPLCVHTFLAFFV